MSAGSPTTKSASDQSCKGDEKAGKPRLQLLDPLKERRKHFSIGLSLIAFLLNIAEFTAHMVLHRAH